MSASIPTTTIEDYFRLMRNWDTDSKKNMIIRLVESLEPKVSADFSACFGAWQDDRNAEEIVQDIYEARRNNPEMESF